MHWLLAAHGTVGGQHCSIGALVKADADLAFSGLDQLGGFLGSECGKVINVLGTLATKTGAVVALHVLPSGCAGGGDSKTG
jgi:hypothetical protein